MPRRVWRQSLGWFRHAPSSISVLRCSTWVRRQPAPAKPHCTCAFHHRHRCDMVYSVAGTRGMCSQPGPLGAPIIQVMKGSPCTRNTRAELVSEPKPSQTFQYQPTNLGKMALMVLFSPILQVSHTQHGSLGSNKWCRAPWWGLKQDSDELTPGVVMMHFSWAEPYPLIKRYLAQSWQYQNVANNAYTAFNKGNSKSIRHRRTAGFKQRLSYYSCFQTMMRADV